MFGKLKSLKSEDTYLPNHFSLPPPGGFSEHFAQECLLTGLSTLWLVAANFGDTS